MKSILKFIAFGIALVGAPSSAQILVAAGEPGSALSKRVKVKSTVPSLSGCNARSSKGSCFRVMFELTPEFDGDIGISVPALMKGFDGYSATGSSCEAVLVRGLKSGAWRRRPDRWDQADLTFANKSRPAILIADFFCDGPIVKTEEVTYQATFHYYVDAATFGEARYLFPRVVVK